MATPSLFNGSDLLFFVGSGSTSVAIAMSKTCSLSIQANMVDTTTKDSVGGWAESIPVGKSWSGSVDGLVVWGNLNQFTDAIFNKTLLEIQFKERAGITGSAIYGGSAWIESLDVDASQDEAVTYSVKFTGCGVLVKTTKTA